MWYIRSTPVGNYSSSCTSVDDAGEAMEQNLHGSCYRFSWPTLVGYNRCLLEVPVYLSQPRLQSIFSRTASHFGYLHTIVPDNATTFTSEVFQQYCKEKGIVHLTGASYHPARNGAAECLIRTFKEVLRKSSKAKALQDFLLMYRRTPTHCGSSPSKLMNGCQIHTKIDTLILVLLQLPLPKKSIKKIRSFKVGNLVYALYCGPRRNRDLRWVPKVIAKTRGTNLFHVHIVPNGPMWRR